MWLQAYCFSKLTGRLELEMGLIAALFTIYTQALRSDFISTNLEMGQRSVFFFPKAHQMIVIVAKIEN